MMAITLRERLDKEGQVKVACVCGHELMLVDRYVTDYPPIPHIEMIEFYDGDSMDPDDHVQECPSCGEYLETDEVRVL